MDFGGSRFPYGRNSALSIRSYDTTTTNGRLSVVSVVAHNCSCRNDMISARGRKCQLYQLLTLYLLPTCMYLAFNTQGIVNGVQEYRNTVISAAHEVVAIDYENIVYHLQLERGTTVMYLNSDKGDEIKLKLEKAYNLTDKAIVDATAAKQIHQSQLLENIQNFRHHVVSNNLTVVAMQAIDVYSNIINILISSLSNELFITSTIPFWSLMISFEWLTIAKEQHGIERAMGSSFLVDGSFDEWDEYFLYVERLFNGEEALSIVGDFRELDSPDLLTNESGVMNYIDLMRIAIVAIDNSSASTIVGQEWFENMTVYISDLQNVINTKVKLITGRIRVHGEETKYYVSWIGALSCFQILLTPFIIRSVYATVRSVHTSFLTMKEKSHMLRQEKRRSDRLLNSMLPRAVSEELKRTGTVQTEAFEECTIYFSDIVGFTKISSKLTPMEVIAMLNALYSLFDARVNAYDCYKVETIGDAYMVVSGVPVRNGKKHVREMACLALDLQKQIGLLSVPHNPSQKMKMRIGLHTGPCVAGVVGTTMPRYCLFGMTVGIAAKMESHGQAGKIHISESTYCELIAHGGFEATERGTIQIKDAGDMKTYWLLGKKNLLTTTNSRSSSRLTVEFNK